jgi:predicted amidohydrolase
MNIALAQMDVQWANPEANLEAAERMVAHAATAGADLVILPELWGSGYDLAHAQAYASALDTGLFEHMAALARRHGLYVTGSLLEASKGHIYNTCVLFGPQGLAGQYRKLHLFRLMQEDRYLTPGDRPSQCKDLPWGVTGLAICYDLRFPELFRGYALDGAQLIVLPAQWPAPRIDHWRTLLRARAIENQCFIAGCNRVGADPDNTFGGASAIVGPWGELLVEGKDHPELLVARIAPEKVHEARRRIPVLSDRRPDCYVTSHTTQPR